MTWKKEHRLKPIGSVSSSKNSNLHIFRGWGSGRKVARGLDRATGASTMVF